MARPRARAPTRRIGKVERPAADHRRSLYPAPRRPRHRLRLRQCGHRFRAHHRGDLAQCRQRPPDPEIHHRAARERRDGDGARLLPRLRQARRRDGARDRRTGNTINGLMNAARDNIPLLLAAGRTPLTETGHIGSRNRSIHWGQESFDQGGLVREFCKWDYELRAGQPVDTLVDRALDIAMSEPRGPVYMNLPREVLAEPAVAPRRSSKRPLGAAPAEPSRRAIEEAA